jgi:L-iditol 2-dehydrogenase
MQAVVYEGPWKMQLADLPEPHVAPGEVLLEVASVGICGSDVHGFTGESGRRAPGMVMGHEVSATVIGHGSGVTSPPLGARVAVYNVIADRAPTPEEGDPSFLNKQMIGVNLGTRGAFAERIAVPADNAILLDDSVPNAVGLLAEPLAVAGHAWDRLAAHNRDAPQRIAILGAGTIGLAAVLVAGDRAPTATGPAVVDVIAEKAAKAVAFGATAVDLSQGTAAADVGAAVEAALGAKPDLVVDAVGTGAAFDTATAIVAEGGCILMIGNLAKQVPLPLQTATSNEWTLIGCYAFTLESFTAAVNLLPKYRDRLATFVGKHCSLAELPATITALAKGELRALKVVVDLA